MSTAESPAVERPLLDASAAARFLGISRRTLFAWDAQGFSPRPLRPVKRKMWARVELAAWRDAGCPPRTKWEARKR